MYVIVLWLELSLKIKKDDYIFAVLKKHRGKKSKRETKVDNTTSTLSDVGSWASLIGLAVTFYTAWTLFRIKNRFLLNAHIEEFNDKISDIASDVASNLYLYLENQTKIEELFALVDVELRAMQKGSSGNLLLDIKNARNLIKRYRSRIWGYSKKNENTAREIKTSLSVISAEIEHHKKSLIVSN